MQKRGSHIGAAVAAALVVLLVTPASLGAQARQSSLGLGIDLYRDSGTRYITRVNRGSSQLDENAQAISSEKMLAVSLSYLTHVLERVRLGGSLRYFGSYQYAREDDPDRALELGQLVELAAQVEYVLPITDALDVLLGGQFGLAVLFAGGDLADSMQGLDRMGFNTWSTPRLGFVAGPQVGARYKFKEWLALRGDFGVLWQQLFLIDASAERAGLRSEESWRVSWTRLRVALSLELMF